MARATPRLRAARRIALGPALTRLLAMVKMRRVSRLLQRVRRMPGVKRRTMVGCVLAAVVGCAVGRAQAEPTADDKALATVLFQEGRALMSAGRIADACLKLEESERLDPSGGTLLNVALCHEQEGRLARSWSEFNDAAVVARRDGRRESRDRRERSRPRPRAATVEIDRDGAGRRGVERTAH